jgi:hypothetical protein
MTQDQFHVDRKGREAREGEFGFDLHGQRDSAV